MSDKTYNGWSNYETWLVKLWIDNEEGSQSYWADRAQEIANHPSYKNEYMGAAERVTHELSEALKDEHEEAASEKVGNSGVFSDLLTSALGEVDWLEIAGSLIEDNDIEIEEDAA